MVIVDEGKITCKAHDCIDGKVYVCKNLASHLDEYGNMPMLRANVALPYVTYCEHHMRRFFLHHSCPRCGRFCSEVKHHFYYLFPILVLMYKYHCIYLILTSEFEVYINYDYSFFSFLLIF